MIVRETARGGFEDEPYPDAVGYTIEPRRNQDFLYERGAIPLGRLAATPRSGDGVMVVLSGSVSMSTN